jgi:cytochrome c-type biogenesis protein CcmH
MTRIRIFAALAAAVVLSLMAGGIAYAVQPSEILADPKLEARARSIGKELRCLVCQNESIDDSNADLAHDLRVLVRQRLVAGDSDEQVKAYIVARYGDYVLLKPPVNSETWLLWFGPAILLVLGGVAAVVFIRHHRLAAPAPLTEAESRRIAALVGEPTKED